MLEAKEKKRMREKRMSWVSRCPYCGAKMRLRSAEGIYNDDKYHTMLYVCDSYPRCDTYVRTIPGTDIPVGTPANGRLRAERIAAHRSFDQMIKTGLMSKDEAYAWLRRFLQRNKDEAHIGCLDVYACRQVAHECSRIMENNKWRMNEHGNINFVKRPNWRRINREMLAAIEREASACC